MSYAELYKYCQTLPVPVSRAKIIPKVVELSRRPRKPFILVRGIDPAVLLGGFIEPAPGSTHAWARWSKGEPIIVVARDLNYCWRRFVVVKELMHYFDPALSRVSNADDFESLIHEFSGPRPDRSPAMDSEVRGLWMALALFCPEELRQDLERKRAAGQMSDIDIAQMLKVPLAMVPNLFDSDFKTYISWLCEC